MCWTSDPSLAGDHRARLWSSFGVVFGLQILQEDLPGHSFCNKNSSTPVGFALWHYSSNIPSHHPNMLQGWTPWRNMMHGLKIIYITITGRCPIWGWQEDPHPGIARLHGRFWNVGPREPLLRWSSPIQVAQYGVSWKSGVKPLKLRAPTLGWRVHLISVDLLSFASGNQENGSLFKAATKNMKEPP